ncbi:MAG: ABC transporter ATP-binding protein [bacterium]|nr:ABC transporter ATP-binding protein [bacterium]
MIALEDVTMRYPVPKRYREYLLHPLRAPRRVDALRDVSLQIGDGDRIGILGPNGVGKTTLLKLIGGLLYPSEGSVIIDGLDSTRDNRNARRKVGFVINEERSFYWRLTGIENLEFFGVLDNLPKRTLAARIPRLLDLVGLDDAGTKRVASYSSGMKQRLAIARGLLADPEILLLDEPTRSLDPIGAQSIRELIAGELHEQRRRTLVVATNSLADILQLCDRLNVLSDGRIVGTKETRGTDEPALVDYYRDCVESTR